jgi:hypothetical protein
VQWREALADDTLEVRLGEPRQRREVAIEETQPVVVVFQVEAPAHPLRQLVDEAELAVVVAGAHPIEHGAGDLGAERAPRRLGDGDLLFEAVAGEQQVDLGLVGPQPPLDDVPRDATVEAQDRVARADPGLFGGRAGRDGDDNGRAHGCTRLRARRHRS